LKGAYEYAIRAEEVTDSGALSKKFWVGEDVKTAIRLGVGLEDGAHRLGGTARNSRLFHHDFG